MSRSARVLLTVVFVLLMAWQIKEEIRIQRRVAAGAGWLTVNGELVSVESKTLARRMTFEKTRHVRYRYEVSGRTYTGTTTALGYVDNPPDHDGMFARGEPVRVYYDPDDPADSSLAIGQSISRLEAVFCSFGAAVFLLILVAWVRMTGQGDRASAQEKS